MSETSKERKIIVIFAIVKNEEGSAFNQGYIGYSDTFLDALKDWSKQEDLHSFVKEILDEGKEGIFKKGDMKGFILSDDFSNIHTMNNTLVIFNDEMMIDIDDWYYSPFKHALENAPLLERYSVNSKEWIQVDCFIGYVENGNFMRIKTDLEKNDYLYAFTAINITHNR